MSFDIIKGLPIPRNNIQSKKPRQVWPWKDMEVGDAVMIGWDDWEKAKNSCNAYSAFHKKGFSRRKVDENSWLFQRVR